MAETTTPTPATPDTSYADPSAFWRQQLDHALKVTRGFRNAGEFVTRQFMGGGDTDMDDDLPNGRLNIFSSNVRILQGMLYGSLPRISVNRMHSDPMDDVGRIASMMLQRVHRVTEDSDVHTTMEQVVLDRLVPGMGVAWLRYDVETTQGADVDGTPMEVVKSESVVTDYVQWSDFVHAPCRTWQECEWVARRHYMTKDQVRQRWPAAVEEMAYTKMQHVGYSPKASMLPKTPDKYASVYEIWHKASRRIYWMAYPTSELGILEVLDVPYKIAGFFPCPKPLRAHFSNANFTPRSDYALAKGQYEALHEVNARIQLLLSSVRVTGIYDRRSEAVKDLLSPRALENRLIPVDNWAMLAEQGGLKGSVDWFPLDQIVATIERLRVYRQDLENLLHEMTGMSDILRGDTRASETLGAQQLKAQFANVRVDAYKRQVARFMEELFQIRTDIMCEMFSDESWLEAAAVDVMYSASPYIKQSLAMLRSPARRKLRIKVSVESLAMPQQEQERKEKLDVVRAMGDFLKSAGPLISQKKAAPVAMALMQWVLTSFPGYDQIEGVIDGAAEQLAAFAQTPDQPPPNPDLEKAQLDIQVTQQRAALDAQVKQQQHAQEMQQSQDEFALEQSQKQQEAIVDMNSKQVQAALDAHLAKVKTAAAVEAATARARAQADKAAKSTKPAKAQE